LGQLNSRNLAHVELGTKRLAKEPRPIQQWENLRIGGPREKKGGGGSQKLPKTPTDQRGVGPSVVTNSSLKIPPDGAGAERILQKKGTCQQNRGKPQRKRLKGKDKKNGHRWRAWRKVPEKKKKQEILTGRKF